HTSLILLFVTLCPTSKITLFPYTTLFRSSKFEYINFIFKIRVIIYGPKIIPTIIKIKDIAISIINIFLNPSFLSCSLDSIFNSRSEEHTSELQSRFDLLCRLLLDKKNDYH